MKNLIISFVITLLIFVGLGISNFNSEKEVVSNNNTTNAKTSSNAVEGKRLASWD